MSTKLLYELRERHIDLDNKNYSILKYLLKVKYSRAKPRVTASILILQTNYYPIIINPTCNVNQDKSDPPSRIYRF